MSESSPQPRLKDIAERAGVSLATVSMALADHPNVRQQTKEMVRRISDELGYRRSSRNYSGSRLRRIGLLMVGRTEAEPVDEPIMKRVSEIGFQQRLRIEFSFIEPGLSVSESVERALRFADGIDGMLMMGQVTSELLNKLDTRGTPAVVMGHTMTEPCSPATVCTVAFDNTAMGELATGYLFGQGYETVAFVCQRRLVGLSQDRWLRGYQMAHVQRGLALSSQLVQVTGHSASDMGTAMDQLLALERPVQAYVVPNAWLAGELIAELGRRGIEPPPDALVYAGIADQSSPNLSEKNSLRGRPALSGRTDILAEHAVRQLRRVARNPELLPVQITVPFEVSHMPANLASTSAGAAETASQPASAAEVKLT